MAFDWMESPEVKQSVPGKQQVINELRDQAQLLRRLGYTLRYATQRCLQNAQWQFEGLSSPVDESEIKKIVASLYNQ